MNNLEELTLDELIDSFILESFPLDSEQYLGAGDELHSKLLSVKQLLPMIESKSLGAQRMAVYIAAQEGGNSKPIFKELLKLIDSPNVAIRDDLCDCFNECASSGEDVLMLLKLLHDNEQRIRLKAISVLSYISEELLQLASKCLRKKPGEPNEYFDIVLEGKLEPTISNLALTKLKNNVNDKNIYIFIKALRSGKVEQIREIAKSAEDPDIEKYYQLYWAEN